MLRRGVVIGSLAVVLCVAGCGRDAGPHVRDQAASVREGAAHAAEASAPRPADARAPDAMPTVDAAPRTTRDPPLRFVVPALPPERPAARPACLTYHTAGWLMDCTEYRPGGAFLRTGDGVARRACSIGQGTWSDTGCPQARLLGTCEDPDFVLYYYPQRHQRITRDELRRTCETPSVRTGAHGTFRPALPAR